MHTLFTISSTHDIYLLGGALECAFSALSAEHVAVSSLHVHLIVRHRTQNHVIQPHSSRASSACSDDATKTSTTGYDADRYVDSNEADPYIHDFRSRSVRSPARTDAIPAIVRTNGKLRQQPAVVVLW